MVTPLPQTVVGDEKKRFGKKLIRASNYWCVYTYFPIRH